MANEITLPVGANAEPDTCGSCKFFDRSLDQGIYYVMNGWCRIKMPPPKELFTPKPWKDGDREQSPNYIKDTERCDLYRPDGKVYIVQRRVPPMREG